MFFVTDRIHKGGISAEWCPTYEMAGYLLTKPIQGSIFKRFIDLIKEVIPQTDPKNGKQSNRKKNQTNKSK